MNSFFFISFFVSFSFLFSQDTVDLNWVNTGSNMTIAILDAPQNIVSFGDTIAVFFNNDDENKCAGFVIWDNDRVALTVWGDDQTTQEKDGFSFNEEIVFVHIKNKSISKILDAKFMVGNNLWSPNGISVIEKLHIE